MSHKLCILYGDELAEYGFDDPHPFGRNRLRAFLEGISIPPSERTSRYRITGNV